MNLPQNYVDEMLFGIMAAHQEYQTVKDSPRSVIWKSSPLKKKVMIVTGGGSGHLPLFLGYVGDGLCDGVAIGNVFSSPSSQTVISVAQALRPEMGVLFVIGNYFGDQMNFEEAAETLNLAGIHSELVIVSDDVASSPKESWLERRGIAGLVYMYKILGAAADLGYSLENLKALANRVNLQLKTLGATLSGCILPSVGKYSYIIPENMMALGMGIHGEAGIDIIPQISVNELVPIMLDKLTDEFDLQGTDANLAVMVNSLGATPIEELYIIFHAINNSLDKQFSIKSAWIGRFATSLETVGISISLFCIKDDWLELLNKPCYSPFFPIQLPHLPI